MHSFQPSRGRILFEVFCALAVVASMVGAWRQTDASALLTAAAAAALYAMVRLFDLGRRDPVPAEEPQRIEFEPEAHDPVPATPAALLPLAAAEPLPPAPEADSEEPEPVEPAPRTIAGRRKGSRKGSGRRAKTSEDAKVVELVPPAEEPVAEFEPAETDEAEPVSLEEASHEPDVADELSPFDEVHHTPVAPLFEPEPYVRQQRVMFGRKAR